MEVAQNGGHTEENVSHPDFRAWVDAEYSSIATSKLFRFLVGPEKEEFTIHSALVAHQSPELDTLVYGKFKESADGAVDWDDIDETTFISFWQYVYTGDYDTPEAVLVIPPNDDLKEPAFGEPPAPEPMYPPPPEPEPDIWGSFIQSKKKGKGQNPLWRDFVISWQVDLFIGEGKAERNVKGPQDYGVIFVHHARVYVLGDRYGITRLMDVSLNKLHGALVEFAADDNELGHIVALLKFCFTELAPERLKQLVVHYSACHVEGLWKTEGFQDLVEDCGEFSKALIGSMLVRLD